MSRVLRSFEFFEPETIAEAAALSRDGGARFLAGGMDLVLKLRMRQMDVSKVVSLQKTADLDILTIDDDGLTIGAMVSMWDVQMNDAVRKKWTALHEGIASVGSAQTKMMGTVVGNLCVGTPVSDFSPPLFALNGTFLISDGETLREVPANEFYLGLGETVVQPGEIVTAVRVPAPQPASGSAFLKMTKAADDIAKVNAAVGIVLDGDTFASVGISMGAVAVTTVGAPDAAKALVGKSIHDTDAILATAKMASLSVTPITDVRSTDVYRKRMVEVMVRDTLHTAIERASNGGAK